MKILQVRNVHEALPIALSYLNEVGINRYSRAGNVILAPWPVTTIYTSPCERVILHPERDANPAFHLYESLWMLAGRNSIAPILRYTKNFANYSDDGVTMHDAYGYRWRKHFTDLILKESDQLKIIAKTLQKNPDDRRSVLTMWDPEADLGKQGKAFPCNLMCTFQIDEEGSLNLVVFCRSNDIIYGCYGANAIHMSVLLEYMAIWIGVPVGTYTQISVNWHMYTNVYNEVLPSLHMLDGKVEQNPYDNQVYCLPLTEHRSGETSDDAIRRLDGYITTLLFHADSGFTLPKLFNDDEPWVEAAYAVLKAHEIWRTWKAPERFSEALGVLAAQDQKVDWIVAMTEWIQRRQVSWESKQLTEQGQEHV